MNTAVGLLRDDAVRASDAATKSRTGWVDCAKGVGITLVVFGHAWRGLGNANILAENGAFRFVDRWVYAFHMPLFFFLSGLFLAKSAAKKSAGPFFREKSVSLLYPFVVWTILLLLMQSMLGGRVNHRVSLADLPNVLFVTPTFWFLPVLFLASVVVFAAVRTRTGLAGIVIAFAALWATWAATGLTGWSPLYFLGENGLYAALGAVAAPVIASRKLPHAIDRPLTVTLIGAFLAVLLTACVTYRFDKNPWLGVIPACVGVAMAILLARQLDRGGVGVVRRLGELSLPIYLANTFAMSGSRIGLQQVLGVRSPTLHLLLGVAAGLAFPVILYAVASRLRVEMFLFGTRVAVPTAPAGGLPGTMAQPGVSVLRAERAVAAGRRKPPSRPAATPWQTGSPSATLPGRNEKHV